MPNDEASKRVRNKSTHQATTAIGLLAGILALAYVLQPGVALPRNGAPVPTLPPVATTIPRQSDWTDYGMIVDVAPFGEGWDAIFEGITPASLVKKDDVYYLYYVGADNYISQKDNIGPAHRAVGVATSVDGIHWTKYPGNPVITFSSSGNPEEGAVSVGVFVDSAGSFHAYYGANIASKPTATKVNANIRLATSPDGFHFEDQGSVIAFSDPKVWGSGDELHSITAWQQDGVWYSYYIPNGLLQSGKLGVAWGRAPDTLSSSAAVTSGGVDVPARGSGSLVPIGADTLAFFLSNRGAMDVRIASGDNLLQLSAPLESYDQEIGRAVVYLDQARRTWFMIYDKWSYMGLRLAPAGAPDTTPPSRPASLTAEASSADSIELNWSPATDPDTGTVQYHVYRGGTRIAATKETSYRDISGLIEQTEYVYEVRAVNYHGTEGPGSTVSVITLADTDAPRIGAAVAVGANEVEVTFSEPVEAASAEKATNYAISAGVGIIAATLGTDRTTVTLRTTPHTENLAYTLSATSVSDLATIHNKSNDGRVYTYSALPGLVAYWRLDTATAAAAEDSSGYGSNGVVQGNPSLTPGRDAAALDLDGIADYVEIDNTPILDATLSNSFTIALWAKPHDTPPDTTSSDGAYTMLSGPNVILEYGRSQDMMGQISTTDGDVSLSAANFAPGRWYHVAIVVDDVAKRLSLYVDGKPVPGAPKPYGGSLVPLPSPDVGVMAEYYSRLRIGVRDPLFDYKKNFFKGALDDVRLYDRALGSEETEQLFNAPRADGH